MGPRPPGRPARRGPNSVSEYASFPTGLVAAEGPGAGTLKNPAPGASPRIRPSRLGLVKIPHPRVLTILTSDQSPIRPVGGTGVLKSWVEPGLGSSRFCCVRTRDPPTPPFSQVGVSGCRDPVGWVERRVFEPRNPPERVMMLRATVWSCSSAGSAGLSEAAPSTDLRTVRPPSRRPSPLVGGGSVRRSSRRSGRTHPEPEAGCAGRRSANGATSGSCLAAARNRTQQHATSKGASKGDSSHGWVPRPEDAMLHPPSRSLVHRGNPSL
jgi:hypothetical protein